MVKIKSIKIILAGIVLFIVMYYGTPVVIPEKSVGNFLSSLSIATTFVLALLVYKLQKEENSSSLK